MTFIYNLVDYLLMNKNEKEIYQYIDNNKSKNIFDVGSFQGKFTKKIIELENESSRNTKSKKKNKYFLFDPNPKAKEYVNKIVKNNNNVNFYNYGVDDQLIKKKFHINKYFEASGSSFQTLIKNDKKWNLSRRFVLNIVNIIAQIHKFFIKGYFKKLENFETIKVKTLTIDLFCKQQKIKKIDLLKIDTEGHEEHVLKGAVNFLKKNKIKLVYVEILSSKKNFSKKKRKIAEFLKQYNFRFIKEYPIKSLGILSNLSASDFLFVNENYSNDK